MKKKISVILLAAILLLTFLPATALATEDYDVTVPTGFADWYAGFYLYADDYVQLTQKIDEFSVLDGLGQAGWTDTDASNFQRVIRWQNPAESPYYGQVSGAGAVSSAESIVKCDPIIVVLLCEDEDMSAGTKWAILVKDADWQSKPTYTKDDIYMSGIFGQEGTDIDVLVDECTYTRRVPAPKDGETYQLRLGGFNMGEFSFARVGSRWAIQNGDGKYLNAERGRLVLGELSTTAWMYLDGAFLVIEQTPGRWLGFIYIPGGVRICYLNTVTGGNLSPYYVGAELYKEVTGEHIYRYVNMGNGTHDRICVNCGERTNEECVYDQAGETRCVCGAFNPEKVEVRISVECKEKTTKQYIGVWPFGNWKDVVVFTAAIKTEATGVKVVRVEYQVNGGRWMNGTFVSSYKPIENLKVRVWDNMGKMYEYEYQEAKIETLADLMALQTNPFPDTYETGWEKNGDPTVKMYYGYLPFISDDSLMIGAPGGWSSWVYATDELTPVANGYAFSFENTDGDTFTVTFVTKGTMITSITIDDSRDGLFTEGTYAPAAE